MNAETRKQELERLLFLRTMINSNLDYLSDFEGIISHNEYKKILADQIEVSNKIKDLKLQMASTIPEKADREAEIIFIDFKAKKRRKLKGY